MPLSRPTDPPLDSELPRPVSLIDEQSGRVPVVESGVGGMLCLLAIGLLLSWVGYGAGLLAEIWPQTVTLLLAVGYAVTFGLGALVVRAGVSNPWIKKYERWRSRSEDRRLDARQARADLARAEAQIAQLK